jgi:mannose-binding lectin 1
LTLLYQVNAVLANQRELVSASRDIKNFVSDVHSKVTAIQGAQGRGQATVQQVGGQGTPADAALLGEIKDSLNHMKRDMANQYAGGSRGGGQAQAQVSCPEVSCSSTTVLLGALAVQLVLLMAYLMYRDSKEAKAKKFY